MTWNVRPYKPKKASPGRTLGHVYLANLYLRFECFGCRRRVGLRPQDMTGFPNQQLRELQDKLVCASCGCTLCELAEVIWCQELPAPLPWPRPLDFKEAAE